MAIGEEAVASRDAQRPQRVSTFGQRLKHMLLLPLGTRRVLEDTTNFR
jgi:hypothetical protein